MFRAIFAPIFFVIIRLKYKIRMEPFPESRKRAFLVLYNHQTAYDQFFVAYTVKRPVYFVAMEDLLSRGWVSSFMRFAVNPIPIVKGTRDFAAVLRLPRKGRLSPGCDADIVVFDDDVSVSAVFLKGKRI